MPIAAPNSILRFPKIKGNNHGAYFKGINWWPILFSSTIMNKRHDANALSVVLCFWIDGQMNGMCEEFVCTTTHQKIRPHDLRVIFSVEFVRTVWRIRTHSSHVWGIRFCDIFALNKHLTYSQNRASSSVPKFGKNKFYRNRPMWFITFGRTYK